MIETAGFLVKLRVTAAPDAPTRGTLEAGGRTYDVALGRGGIVADKREGDGGTPAGKYLLRRAFYRADRVAKLKTGLPLRAITPLDGWSDDPADKDYNCLVTHPTEGERALSAERMWRDDDIYDVVIVLGHNDDPPVPGNGSAIFVHLARDGFTPTEGCIALKRDDLLSLVEKFAPGTVVEIVLTE
ncbi:L,D-transpeptidase [Tepidamorphus sp. 3E244]|uniref:L,D-transpeptidase family protein n=1 Tax=Tepidamorphus sp. 3E244 TaxID=3385498 RepID=UPI0038FBE980